jgi:hypothetical protein
MRFQLAKILSQRLRACFRQRRIDIHARADFEPGALSDSWDDRDVPVEMPRLLFLRSERPKDEIKGRIAQHAVDLSQDCPQGCGKFGQSFEGLL